MDRRKALQSAGWMAGAAFTMPTLISLLQSCKSETRQSWQPLFFDEGEAKFISSIVDQILPRTNTPGALDVKVDLFIDKVVAKTFSSEGQQDFRSGISNFNEMYCQGLGADFVGLNDDQKKEVLRVAEAKSGKFGGSVWGTAVGKQEPIGFYRSLKSMAIWGYFTSEEIGEKVLNYDPIPQQYLGCIPLSDVGNRYSL
ncbi:gluconate 2-dehydrogenase subunit 3 family protein [Muriicola sp. Z0-33]|uniref:gluconate 2-dehydrogenase subunit 3 family protein n=1 Tax=Muriicola sp. Z0-33 TaxID=2816957 RepID=UPI0022372002|nr:gluconate 2-dehydrogenase subunit 3 family protein [Muriicola sp. Z0-33]MCW5517634.1 gluconate 2-dehydrogenase subunit 3 family protein [Muriicola sp. Z0-33]